ncbi:hypothetical protein ACO0LC_11415 [Undibacterium sp. JH2W]|uniref:hypothetical protein n=1 Tax=Undibacterium sp. JH2W TaxID=3413037 RepID=UPI003BF25312
MIKSINKTQILFCFASFLSASAVAETDTLWSKTFLQYQAANLWVPKEIRTQLEAERKDQPGKTKYIKSTLSSWEKHDPVYTNVSTNNNWQVLTEETKSVDGINNMLMSLDKMKSSLLVQGSVPLRLENQNLDGRNLAVFELSDGGMGKKVSIKMWVAPDTACMVKMDTSIHITLYADVNFSTRYTEPNKDGLCLHSLMQGNIDMQIPFKKGNIHIKQSNSDWTPRPAN